MSVNTIVPLTNVGLLAQAVESAANRPPELPGLVVMYGPSGYGKSLAAAYRPTCTAPTTSSAGRAGPRKPS